MTSGLEEFGSAATTGLEELDDALEGLYWGDSVVWELEEGVSAEPFYRAIADSAAGYHFAAYVTLTTDPRQLQVLYPQLLTIDARPGSPLASPARLLETISSSCHTFDRDLLLFDGLDAMAQAWGAPAAAELFSSASSLLLELGAIAYWTVTTKLRDPVLRKALRLVPQCVLVLGDERLRVWKAEGRSPGIEGRVYRYENGQDGPVLTPAPALARLGEALRAIRAELGLSQSEIARLAGVTPSAVSQAERGRRGLSLETLLQLTEKLNIGLDQLLQGTVRSGYRLAKHHDPRERGGGKPLPLLDDPSSGYRIHAVYLPPHGSAFTDTAGEGVEMVAVASGLVQVLLSSGAPVLRQGEALLVEEASISAWRNLCDREAMLFWISRADLTKSNRGG